MKGELCLDFSVANRSHKKLEVVHIVRISVGWSGVGGVNCHGVVVVSFTSAASWHVGNYYGMSLLFVFAPGGKCDMFWLIYATDPTTKNTEDWKKIVFASELASNIF